MSTNSRDELLRRLAHPFWFQSFGAVMGMDWHSSGITTSVLGALKRGLGPVEHELGLHVCGGRGRHSRKTPAELLALGERTGLDGAIGSRPAAPEHGSALKPAMERPLPTPRQQKLWYTFMAVGHSAAAFDAYSTRRALSGNYGTEGNPLLRPFAHSNAMYAATQVSPAVMDYVGRRMMTSSHPALRKFWWVPQVAGAGFSFGAGMHNYVLTQ